MRQKLFLRERPFERGRTLAGKTGGFDVNRPQIGCGKENAGFLAGKALSA